MSRGEQLIFRLLRLIAWILLDALQGFKGVDTGYYSEKLDEFTDEAQRDGLDMAGDAEQVQEELAAAKARIAELEEAIRKHKLAIQVEDLPDERADTDLWSMVSEA